VNNPLTFVTFSRGYTRFNEVIYSEINNSDKERKNKKEKGNKMYAGNNTPDMIIQGVGDYWFLCIRFTLSDFRSQRSHPAAKTAQ